MKTPKTYTIKKTYKGRDTITSGTLDELHKYFGYTLEIGNSWNKKIKLKSATIAAFVKNLQASYEEKESCCYERTYVELIETPVLQTENC